MDINLRLKAYILIIFKIDIIIPFGRASPKKYIISESSSIFILDSASTFVTITLVSYPELPKHFDYEFSNFRLSKHYVMI